MRAHELLDSDDQEAAENAAEILRTMARAIDNLRYVEDLVEGGTAAWSGYADALSIIAAHWRIQSGGAPVEDWLDDQGAAPVDPALAAVPFDDWPTAAKARMLAAVLPHAQPSTPTTPPEERP